MTIDRQGDQDPHGTRDTSRRNKTFIPDVVDVGTFHERFGTDEKCLAHLRELRWGKDLERFVCPDCGHPAGWWLENRKLVECSRCRHQTSLTAGTVFHRIRTPIRKWFWAIYQMAQDKKGIAAIELAKQIGVCFHTAWLMLHKLRRAMKDRTQSDMLQGLVEVGQTQVGGKWGEAPGLEDENKTPIAVAVELDEAKTPKRIALGALSKVSAPSMRRFAGRAIVKGATLRTDGLPCFRTIAQAGFAHEVIETGRGQEADQLFRWVHTFVGNLKRMLTGTYHNVSRKYLQGYLAEFAYRANRRWEEATLFDRLLGEALTGKPLTRKELMAGGM